MRFSLVSLEFGVLAAKLQPANYHMGEPVKTPMTIFEGTFCQLHPSTPDAQDPALGPVQTAPVDTPLSSTIQKHFPHQECSSNEQQQESALNGIYKQAR